MPLVEQYIFRNLKLILKQATINIVKSTSSILAEHGEVLTQHFYKRMFENNPEVLPFFNSSNQQSGNQQRALASAITAYASNIDNLSVLESAVNTIVQKHVSLQIKEEHYPIVGENLIESIKEVLGELATQEVVTAWEEAYWFLAKLLIDAEKKIYESNANKKGGWEGFRDFTVSKKVKESDNITSFYLIPTDGKELPSFYAGQYITVQLPSKDGNITTMRNYSLSDVSGTGYFRISIKKEVYDNENHNGYVSNLFHESIKENDVIKVAPPCGEFILKTNNQKPLVLLAGGVGITPILSMLKTSLTDVKREVILIYGSYSPAVHAFKDEINNLLHTNSNLKVHYCYNHISNEYKLAKNESIEFITKELMIKLGVKEDSYYYFCGPKMFMVNMYQMLSSLNIATDQINFEFFGPKEDLQKPVL